MSRLGFIVLTLIFGGTIAMLVFITLTIMSEMAPIR